MIPGFAFIPMAAAPNAAAPPQGVGGGGYVPLVAGLAEDVWSLVALPAIVALLVLLIASIPIGLAAHRRRIETGREQMIGAVATVLHWRDGSGHVFVHGERWQAQGVCREIDAGVKVLILGIEGLLLTVEPVESIAADRASSFTGEST